MSQALEYYKQQVITDVKDYYEDFTIGKSLDDIDEILENMQDSDSITGNGSGSYYCNVYDARQAINESNLLWDSDFHSWLEDLGMALAKQIERGAEVLDVLARDWAFDMARNEIEDFIISKLK